MLILFEPRVYSYAYYAQNVIRAVINIRKSRPCEMNLASKYQEAYSLYEQSLPEKHRGGAGKNTHLSVQTSECCYSFPERAIQNIVTSHVASCGGHLSMLSQNQNLESSSGAELYKISWSASAYF